MRTPAHALLLLLALLLPFIGPPAQAAETVTYYHTDALGSPVAATDASGNLVWRETYRPYGERLNNQPASSDNPIWYTGKRQDAETGLVYMGSRYYDPRLGRFLSIDPVEPDENNLHSLNRYAYANNNPYKFTDPDGQAAETVIDVVSLGLSINAFRQDPSFINGLAVAYDGLATAVPFLPGGIGIIRQGASKGGEVTQALKQAADRGTAKAGDGAQKVVKESTSATKQETGSYTNLHVSGKTYDGKGSRARSQESGRRVERETGDQHIATDWTSARTPRDAFKQEPQRLDTHGGPKSSSNYNKIESPGKQMRQNDGT